MTEHFPTDLEYRYALWLDAEAVMIAAGASQARLDAVFDRIIRVAR